MSAKAQAFVLTCAALGLLAGCGDGRGINSDLNGVTLSAGGGDDGSSGGAADTGAADEGDEDDDRGGEDEGEADEDDDGGGPSGPALDVGHPGCDDGECPEGCVPPEHTPCDEDSNSMDHALGLGCEDALAADVSRSGNSAAVAVTTGFGPSDEWNPVEGGKILVIGTGLADSLINPDPAEEYLSCSDDLGEEYDPGGTLPEPLVATAVDGDCEEDPTLVGTGDCSRTVGEQFDQGGDANDYTEVRIEMAVPEMVSSLTYSFAFMSTEWPIFVGGDYNDMFVGWLESEMWTGNVSFDEAGSPISVNAGFLDFQDETAEMAEFEGTCMSGHAATKWLETTAPVAAGEDIVLVFSIFDMSDSIYDSFVLVDNVQFGCADGQPETTPAG